MIRILAVYPICFLIVGCVHSKKPAPPFAAAPKPNAICFTDPDTGQGFFLGSDGMIVVGKDCQSAMEDWKKTPTPTSPPENII